MEEGGEKRILDILHVFGVFSTGFGRFRFFSFEFFATFLYRSHSSKGCEQDDPVRSRVLPCKLGIEGC